VLKHVARMWGFGVNLESVDQWGDVSSHWSIAPPEGPAS
jgi:stage V sporulation protein R